MKKSRWKFNVQTKLYTKKEATVVKEMNVIKKNIWLCKRKIKRHLQGQPHSVKAA